MTEKAYVYVCPACKGNVASDVKTGKLTIERSLGTSFLSRTALCRKKVVNGRLERREEAIDLALGYLLKLVKAGKRQAWTPRRSD